MRTFIFIIIASAFLTGCFNLDSLDKAVVDKNKELSGKAHEKVGEQVEEGKQKIKKEVKQKVQNKINDIMDNKLEDIKN